MLLVRVYQAGHNRQDGCEDLKRHFGQIWMGRSGRSLEIL